MKNTFFEKSKFVPVPAQQPRRHRTNKRLKRSKKTRLSHLFKTSAASNLSAVSRCRLPVDRLHVIKNLHTETWGRSM